MNEMTIDSDFLRPVFRRADRDYQLAGMKPILDLFNGDLRHSILLVLIFAKV
jgi:hypothetical protein